MKRNNLFNKQSLLPLVYFLSLCLLFASCKKDAGQPSIPAPNTGQFTINGKTYSGACTAVPDVAGSGGIDVVILDSASNAFGVYNMPSQSSGSYTLSDGYINVASGNLYALVASTAFPNAMASKKGGTITKTGSTSFSFSGTMYDISNNNSYTATGRGSY